MSPDSDVSEGPREVLGHLSQLELAPQGDEGVSSVLADLQPRDIATVVDLCREVRQGAEDVYGLACLLDGLLKLAHGDDAPGHPPSLLDALDKLLSVAIDIDQGDAVLLEPGADLLEDHGVPLVVSKTPIYPDVLTAHHCHLLSELLQVARLLVAHRTGFLRVGSDITLPLRHHGLEVIRVNVHNVLQGEDVVLGEPAHGVALAGTHGAASEDHPRPVLRLGALGNAPHDLVLPRLSLAGVVRVPRIVQRPAYLCKLTINIAMLCCIVLFRGARALRCLDDKVRMAVCNVSRGGVIIVVWHMWVHLRTVVDRDGPEEGITLDAMPELVKADLATLVGVQVRKEPPDLHLRQREVQLLHADLQEFIGRDGPILVDIDLLKGMPEFAVTEAVLLDGSTPLTSEALCTERCSRLEAGPFQEEFCSCH
mmetsp:Transcript_148325/g.413168  ORF Transcript_148325/g.413168 Transcript_148325/m.413168 type:complete len:424 (-) Transcript_148325:418-1689(-)